VTPSPLPKQLSAAVCVVWDFDGVIADTEPCQARAYELVLAQFGVECEPGWFDPFVGTTERAIWPRLIAEHGLAALVDDLVAARSNLFLGQAETLTPAWYVKQVLDLAVPHHIVSAGNHDQILRLVDSWEIGHRFVSVRATGSPATTADDDKESRLLNMLGEVGEGVVLFEDSSRYLELARAFGATTVGVQHSLNQQHFGADLIVDHRRPGIWSKVTDEERARPPTTR
jgi:phosphoglycolate phosphatase-like HAD superfamily hydrolase